MCLQVKVMVERASNTAVDDCSRGAVSFSVGEVRVCGVEAGMVTLPADDDYDLWFVVGIGSGDGLAGLFDERELVAVDSLELAVRDTVTEVEDFFRQLFGGVVFPVVLEAGDDQGVEVFDHLDRNFC